MVETISLLCPGCGFDLKPAFLTSSDYQSCHICGLEMFVQPFPACYATKVVIDSEQLQRGEEDGSCFHHATKKAVDSCTRCGKFLCALCTVPFGKEVLCPECLVSGAENKTDQRLETERTLYDTIALMLAVGPAMTLSLSIFGAPAAVFVALRYWKRPTSIVRKYRWRNYLALVFALAQIGFWTFTFVTMIEQGTRAK